MSIQSFLKSSTGFFDDSYHARIYPDGTTVFFKQGPFMRLFQKGPVILGVFLAGLHVGKYIARHIRDHSLNQFANLDSAVIRNACRTYHYLFPAGSARKYFVEVALADNFFTALQLEILLHTLPRPLNDPVGSDMDEAILSVARVCFLAYCIDKVRLVVYKILLWVPSDITLAFALDFAPTGIYSVRQTSGERFEFRN